MNALPRAERQTYRYNTSRRMRNFERFMRERFPASQANGVEWYDCIDVSKLDDRDTALCIFSQLASSTYWPHALGVLHIPSSNVELKHIGTMLYSTSETAIKRGWDVAEAKRLNEAFKKLIERLQSTSTSSARTMAEDIVQSVSSRT